MTLFRVEILKAVVASNQPGLIFIFVFSFDLREDWDIFATRELFFLKQEGRSP